MARLLLGKNVVAIDIGTTKICVLIAEVDDKGHINVTGIGHYPSLGLKKGVIVNITQTVQSIKKAVAQAEAMAGIKIETAAVGISGGHIQSFNSKGIIAIKRKDVSQYDIDRVIEEAKAVAIPEDREVLHIIPQYFRVDGQEFVQDSLGMHGIRLEAQVHIITGAVSSAQNIVKACELAGIQVTDIVLEQIASADAVLTKSERELGVGILDIGGGTSDFAVYKDGKIRHSKVIPIAGNLFTSDLAIGLGINLKLAEELKCSHGFVAEDLYLNMDQDSIDVELGYDNKVKKVDTYALYEILEPRAREIFDILYDEINEFRLSGFMPSGLVLTGGGALLAGMQSLAREVFGMNVRIGQPQGYSHVDEVGVISDMLKSPVYATGYGLLVYALQSRDHSLISSKNDPVVAKVFKSMKAWIYDFL